MRVNFPKDWGAQPGTVGSPSRRGRVSGPRSLPPTRLAANAQGITSAYRPQSRDPGLGGQGGAVP